MINIEILEKITLDCVVNNPDKLFVLGENSFELSSLLFYTNTLDFSIYENSSESYRKSIIEKIILIKIKSKKYNSIVLCDKGYCKNCPPSLMKFINDLIRYNFDFDNSTGKKWFKIPSFNEITTAEYLNLSTNNDLLIPQNNSFFRPEYLENGLYTSFDLLKTESKIAFTSNKNFEVGQNLILQFINQKKYILCRVVLSYNSNLINDEDWSLLEGYTDDFVKSVNRNDYYQIHIRFISELDEFGNMIFREDLFKNVEPVEEIRSTENKQVHGNISNQDIYNLLVEINQKLDKLLK